MPEGLVIIEFDDFEGAKISFKYPEEFDVEDKYVQQINISHNFISSIMLNKDDTINAISYYNEEHLKTVVLFLKQREDGQDYYEIIRQLDDVFLRELADGEKEAELRRIYDLSTSIINVREQVLVKQANELADVKSELHEYKLRLEEMMNVCTDPEMCILIALTLVEQEKKEELLNMIPLDDQKKFEGALDNLVMKDLIKIYKNTNVRINF